MHSEPTTADNSLMRLARPPASFNAQQHVRASAQLSEHTALAVLRVEQLARRASTLHQLQHLAANESRGLCRAQQAYVIEAAPAKPIKIAAVSGAARGNSTLTLIAEVGALLRRLEAGQRLAGPFCFRLPAHCAPESELAASSPHVEGYWIPLLDRAGAMFGGLLLMRNTAWSEPDIAVSKRLAETYAHAWQAFTHTHQSVPRRSRVRALVEASVLAVLVLVALSVV